MKIRLLKVAKIRDVYTPREVRRQRACINPDYSGCSSFPLISEWNFHEENFSTHIQLGAPAKHTTLFPQAAIFS